MLSDGRRNLIKNIALRDGEVTISKVAKEIGVSLETVRRDINILCRENILEKVHGGAVPVKITQYEDEYGKRKSTNQILKSRLGTETAKIISDKKVVMLSSGTTLEAVASACGDKIPGVVITNSLPVAEIFGKIEDKSKSVILVGGELNTKERFTFGTEAMNIIEKYRSDIAVISCVGIDDKGAMCSSADEGNIIRSIMKSSSKVILVTTSDKFGKKSVYRFCNLSDIDEIITDNETAIPESIKKAARKDNVNLCILP